MSISYYDGFYSYYGIIGLKYDIGLNDIVYALKNLSIPLALYAAMCYFTLNFIEEKFKVHRHLIHLIIISVFYSYLIILNSLLTDYKQLLGLLVILFLWIIEVFLPIILLKSNNTIEERLDIYSHMLSKKTSQANKRSPEFSNIVYKIWRVSYSIFIILIITEILYQSCSLLGKKQASQKSDYYALADDSSAIIVYSDDSKFVIMNLVSENTLENCLRVVQVSEATDISFVPYTHNLVIKK